MNAPAFEHPSLRLQVTEEQRDRAAVWLQDAYAHGQLSEYEFDRRIGMVISADNRRDLNEAFLGLVSVPMASQALGAHPAYQPMPNRTEQVGRGTGAAAHFLALVTWIFGPLVIFLGASKGSFTRREAAKSFNFQVISAVTLIVAGIVGGVLLPDAIANVLMPLLWLGWLLGTIIGGAKAAAGENWVNPVKKVLRLNILPENERR